MEKARVVTPLTRKLYERYYRRFEDLLVKKNGAKTMVQALKLLQGIEDPKLILGVPLRHITDQIFMGDKHGVNREAYKEYLREKGLNWAKFDVRRLISEHQYELALVRAMEWFAKDSDKGGNVQNLLKEYQFPHLLEQASKRGDTIMLEQLLDILEKNTALGDSNRANVLIGAVCQGDFGTTDKILETLKLDMLTDNALFQVGMLYLENQDMEKVHELLTVMRDGQYKFRLVMEMIGTFEVNEAFKLLDHMVKSSPAFDNLDFRHLPMVFHQIKETNDFEFLDSSLKLYGELENPKVKTLLLESLLVSIGNLYTGFNSDVFVINYMLANKIPISGRLRDIVCHNVSHINLRLTTLNVLDVLDARSLTEENWCHMFKPLLHGTEPDPIYLYMIRHVEARGEICKGVQDRLEWFVDHTNDRNIRLFLQDSSLEAFKERINVHFIERNLENEAERMRNQYPLLPGFHPYNYEIDMRVRGKLQA